VLYVANIRHGSDMDGPGKRTVIHFAGCSIRCPGCVNKHYWDRSAGVEMHHKLVSGRAMLDEKAMAHGDTGVTVYGGEPFDQPKRPLYRFLRDLQYFKTVGQLKDGVIVYTGYTLEAIQNKVWFKDFAKLGLIDVLIDGPYIDDLNDSTIEMKGSANQRMHFMTDRLSPMDFKVREASVTISPFGIVTLRGFPDADTLEAVECTISSPAPTAATEPGGR
jgi:anaerobic ribonucleoside-triphosphate reductase activating protein